ncbi:MGMT family protein [Rhodococcus sp. I2R]|uniref:MGMT family protein n=1 Tax=Rhodococcus sp. I2R TaxID=2855445 RepID=UPI001E443FDD|nr:MGMT family protein [Rhodococcus sp. I2R]MCC8928367.1 MGMT family protein [Rhodococcus sp. I2R]
MAAITEVQIERVRSLVASVPAELSSPRTVGAIMRMDSADLPWHRVLSASGKPAPHLAERQLAKLREEGVTVRDGRVDLRLVRFTFS